MAFMSPSPVDMWITHVLSGTAKVEFAITDLSGNLFPEWGLAPPRKHEKETSW